MNMILYILDVAVKILLILSATLLLHACADIKPGPRGPPGEPGSSCSVAQLSNGAQITCDDGTSAIISNGIDGQDAVLPVGYTYISEGAYYIIAIEDLCGNGAEEVLFRLNTGELIAHYTHGSKQYLTILSPGPHTSTDGYNCSFTVGPAPSYIISY